MDKDFIFNSDYPMDKIVWLNKGEITTNNLGEWKVEIEHGLNCTPFVKGVWSLDGFKTAWTFGTLKQQEQFISDDAKAFSDGKKIIISGFTTPNAKLQYHLWAFANEKETQGVNFDNTGVLSSDPFIFNSDFLYPGLFAEGYLEKGQRFEHGLGYVPFVEAWQIADNGLWTASFGGDISKPDFIITKNAIALRATAFTPKVYYRIYV